MMAIMWSLERHIRCHFLDINVTGVLVSNMFAHFIPDEERMFYSYFYINNGF